MYSYQSNDMWHQSKWSLNKIAFQYDAYRPLQWPSGGGGGWRGCIPACTGQGGFVSQYALGGGGGGCIPACTGPGGVCLEVSAKRGCLFTGVSALGVSDQGVSAQGGVCLERCLPGGCLSQCMLGYTPPPCGQNSWHTLVKKLLRCGR